MTRHHFSIVSVLLFILVVSLIGAPAIAAADTEQAEITKTAEAFVAAFAKGDASALAAFWTPDGDYLDIGGRELKGRTAIADDFADLFSQNKGLTLRIEVASIRFPTPDTAIEDGVTSVLSPEGLPPNRARYTNFLVKKDGKWLLSSVREAAYEPPNNSEHLRPIEWLIGEWVQDVKDGPVTHIVFEWSPGQNFIIASRAVDMKGILLDNGHQRIGWDPSKKLIRSWSFEADGGFGEGAWTKEGDAWVNRVSSVLRSGGLMTATTVVNRVDPDTISVVFKDQQMDGKPIADSLAITLKRMK